MNISFTRGTERLSHNTHVLRRVCVERADVERDAVTKTLKSKGDPTHTIVLTSPHLPTIHPSIRETNGRSSINTERANLPLRSPRGGPNCFIHNMFVGSMSVRTVYVTDGRPLVEQNVTVV